MSEKSGDCNCVHNNQPPVGSDNTFLYPPVRLDIEQLVSTVESLRRWWIDECREAILIAIADLDDTVRLSQNLDTIIEYVTHITGHEPVASRIHFPLKIYEAPVTAMLQYYVQRRYVELGDVAAKWKELLQ